MGGISCSTRTSPAATTAVVVVACLTIFISTSELKIVTFISTVNVGAAAVVARIFIIVAISVGVSCLKMPITAFKVKSLFVLCTSSTTTATNINTTTAIALAKRLTPLLAIVGFVVVRKFMSTAQFMSVGVAAVTSVTVLIVVVFVVVVVVEILLFIENTPLVLSMLIRVAIILDIRKHQHNGRVTSWSTIPFCADTEVTAKIIVIHYFKRDIDYLSFFFTFYFTSFLYFIVSLLELRSNRNIPLS
mmetsp:Transcript_18234/g.37457  ORF Transcript_18234/g.37457 Transcript_18234/m.37457 type:complete len:246 (-) Transcript_18234:2453-3190(-)